MCVISDRSQPASQPNLPVARFETLWEIIVPLLVLGFSAGDFMSISVDYFAIGFIYNLTRLCIRQKASMVDQNFLVTRLSNARHLGVIMCMTSSIPRVNE